MTPDEARRLLMRYGVTGAMTRRQETIITMIAEGKTVAQIAGELGIQPGTVHAHVSRAKMDVQIYDIRRERTRPR
jgi:DNA-binding CsgD family transcriptional regulator